MKYTISISKKNQQKIFVNIVLIKFVEKYKKFIETQKRVFKQQQKLYNRVEKHNEKIIRNIQLIDVQIKSSIIVYIFSNMMTENAFCHDHNENRYLSLI